MMSFNYSLAMYQVNTLVLRVFYQCLGLDCQKLVKFIIFKVSSIASHYFSHLFETS